MSKEQVLAEIKRVGIVPVVRARSSDEAMQLCDALIAGGVTTLEITMTVPDAVKLIEKLNARFSHAATVGAGTVLDAAEAHRCIGAGARFIVSPALDLETVDLCKRTGIAVLPGALTPTEVVAAWRAGADVVKVFPADAMGGASYLRALKAPLPQIELMPTGGVTLETAAAFIDAGAVALGVGSDLVNLAAIRRGEADLITKRARDYVEIVRAARVKSEASEEFIAR